MPCERTEDLPTQTLYGQHSVRPRRIGTLRAVRRASRARSRGRLLLSKPGGFRCFAADSAAEQLLGGAGRPADVLRIDAPPRTFLFLCFRSALARWQGTTGQAAARAQVAPPE